MQGPLYDSFRLVMRILNRIVWSQLGLVIVLVPVLNAANWPRFRGPNGTGIASDRDVPVRWSEGDGILWKTEIPVPGNSSPVVWQDGLFLQSATPDGAARMLHCINVGDGKILWSQSVRGSYGMEFET